MKRISLALILALPACTALQPTGVVIPNPTADWRSVATPEDRERLREWRSAFVSALQAARTAGHSEEIARQGALLQPDSALSGGPIPNGAYRCRVIKLGAQSEGLLDYVAYPAFSCRIARQGQLQSFAKVAGSQRYVGSIFSGDGLRQVFLGTLVLGDEERAMQYGSDRARDVAGWVEQIGPNRWRMIMPRPRFESRLDLLELVPVS